ncbi:MAG: copper amine oxidase N-terminal domain-containing protein [Defluviitaleaceae bacterium]|nr:copper amine oxidase N-terminal domain-containing protein [Defluviitaleaceae bacterium]
MKKIDIKSIIIGFLLGSIGITTVFAVGSLGDGIQSASFNSSKVYFYGQEVPLESPLVSILKEGETNMQTYMPLRELLEYMNFIVDWNPTDSSINLTMRGNANINTNSSTNQQPQAWDGTGVYSGGYSDDPSTLSQVEADMRAIDIIQRTGNWSFVEPYLPYLSNNGIQSVVDIFNSKRPNHPSQHKNANDYMRR